MIVRRLVRLEEVAVASVLLGDVNCNLALIIAAAADPAVFIMQPGLSSGPLVAARGRALTFALLMTKQAASAL